MNDEPISSVSCPRCGKENLRGPSLCDGCDAELPGGGIASKPARLEHESDAFPSHHQSKAVEFVTALAIITVLAISFAVNPFIGAVLTAVGGVTLTLLPRVRHNRGCLFLLGLTLTLLTVLVVLLGGAVFIAIAIICKPFLQT